MAIASLAATIEPAGSGVLSRNLTSPASNSDWNTTEKPLINNMMNTASDTLDSKLTQIRRATSGEAARASFRPIVKP
ncbi:MAG: hypothetical protein BWY85_01989 [Firmicutes bacterium ADurb.Bin506]|nr:MAG: hypothetical protein BWY85_01989 [Firmicutes bacterium ADurb.Bin506]